MDQSTSGVAHAVPRGENQWVSVESLRWRRSVGGGNESHSDKRIIPPTHSFPTTHPPAHRIVPPHISLAFRRHPREYALSAFAGARRGGCPEWVRERDL